MLAPHANMHLPSLLACLLIGMFTLQAESETMYFVSSSLGNDENSGLSKNFPWASLDRVNRASLSPGDSVRFKTDDIFYGQLVINQSGSAEKPLVFTSYGSGNPAEIDGSSKSHGDNLTAILIIDQDHIEISHLTIRNFRKRGRQKQTVSQANSAESISLSVRAPNVKKVTLHSNRFGWDRNHPKGIAKNNGDGTWSVDIAPAWRKTALYKWVLDGKLENIEDDVSRGRCGHRIRSGTIISTKNSAHRFWEPGNGNIENDVAGNCKRADGVQLKTSPQDFEAYGILVKNTGQRTLRGFEFHHLTVEQIYPLSAKNKFKEQAFVDNTVTGIRFETLPSKKKKNAAHTRDVFVHENLIRNTGRFGIAMRHRASKISGLTGTSLDYDVNFIVLNNRCEDLGGSCVLMSGVWQGLLEGNTFIRSGAMVEPSVSVNRGSGAWFFRSNHIVAQNNVAAFSRGHNDSAGIHVDYNNENILVQYNFSYDNEGYGTEILGSNKNIIWRYNISVGDGTRKINVPRPEGGQSKNPGGTLHLSDFAKPKRQPSSDVFIYNNTYLISSGSAPNLKLIARNLYLSNNLFIVEEDAELGDVIANKRWLKEDSIINNGFSGNVSSAFSDMDGDPKLLNLLIKGEPSDPESFAFPYGNVAIPVSESTNQQPVFPAAGSGIFSHVSNIPEKDFFGNTLMSQKRFLGAGTKGMINE